MSSLATVESRKVSSCCFAIISTLLVIAAILFLVLGALQIMQLNSDAPISLQKQAKECLVVTPNFDCQKLGCFAMVKYSTEDTQYISLQRPTYSLHKGDSPYAFYTAGQSVVCYYDEKHPQLVNYNQTTDSVNDKTRATLTNLAYAQFGISALFIVFGTFTLIMTVCCGCLYRRAKDQLNYNKYKAENDEL
ncbi:hypothetical protein ABK040_015992 [Willaertia magna]